LTPALRLDLRPSRLLAVLLLLAHGLALTAVWISLDAWARALLGAGIVLSGAYSAARALHLLGQGVASLELHEDGRASWSARDGGRREGRLGRNNFVSAVLVVLELESAGRGRTRVVLMGDSATPDDLRRLRVWLRWRGRAEAPEE
jgi:toxin CptA